MPIPVVAATHSQIVVDLVGPERVIVARKRPGEGTVLERIQDPGRLAKALADEGIALSDYIFYAATREDEDNKALHEEVQKQQ